MNSQYMSLLQIYVLLVPVAVGALGLGVFWLTGWMDRREERAPPGRVGALWLLIRPTFLETNRRTRLTTISKRRNITPILTRFVRN